MASRGAALVTGGARRIGRALVVAAAEAGFDVAIHVRTVDDDAEAAAAEVRAKGRKAQIFASDLRRELRWTIRDNSLRIEGLVGA